MQTVLIAGAGRSSTWLIDYMLENARNKWEIIVMDADEELIHDKLNNHPKGTAAVLDIHNEKVRRELVKRSDLVISLMPPNLHLLLAQDCLLLGKHLITPSYMTEEIRQMDAEVRKAGLLFMCEMGLDPGIDHMSVSKIIKGVHRIAGRITSLKTSCGGLVAKDSDDNPWHYKIAWNPRNVVLAGKDGASWKENGKEVSIGYKEIFEHPQKVKIDGLDTLAEYPNRDALRYEKLYDLFDVKTLMRTTLRYPAYIKGWNYIVKAGLTDDSDSINAEELTYAGWVAQKTGLPDDSELMNNFKNKFQVDDKTMKNLEWLRLFEPRLINGEKGETSASTLQQLIERRWKMRTMDKDMAIMEHEVEYERRGEKHKVKSTLKVVGQNKSHSAMAKCVGLPMGILAKRILDGQLDPKSISGVHIPVLQEVYVPVLRELGKMGIGFVEQIG